jgi:glycosyltransferase involved in cell wall biosynthesis
MNIGILLPGFSSDEQDWALPVQLNLVREMARHDDVRVLALRYPHRRDCYQVFGAVVYSLGVGQVRGAGRLALWWDALRTVRRLHQQKPFDVLHAMWADETGLIAAWAGRWLNIPVAVSVAGGELVGFDDIRYGLQRSAFSRWTVRQALTGANRIVVACSYVRRLLAAAGYAIPGAKVHTIALGVDRNALSPFSELRDPRRLVHVASLVGVKDQVTLLRALAQIDDAALDIVGDGPERERLAALAVGLGMADRVNFVGAVPYPGVATYYRRAALNVLSSRHEGLGMVALEAAACGTPTVSTAVGLLPDYPELGVVVPVGDDGALAEAIRALLDDPQRRAALGQSAHKTVVTKFTVQHTAQQFRALYEALIEELQRLTASRH